MKTPVSADTRRRIQGHIARLGDSDQKVSGQAEVHLARFGSKAVDALVRAASSPDPQVRFRVAWTLGKTRDPRALPTLLTLIEDPDERVAYDAIIALGDLGHPDAISVLHRLKDSPPDDRCLDCAAYIALMRLGVLTEDDAEAGEERRGADGLAQPAEH